MAWLKHDWEGRKQYAPHLFKRIRFGIVPTGHLSTTVFECPDLYSIPEFKETVKKVMAVIDSRKPSDPPLHIMEPSLFSTRTTVNVRMLYIGFKAQ